MLRFSDTKISSEFKSQVIVVVVIVTFNREWLGYNSVNIFNKIQNEQRGWCHWDAGPLAVVRVWLSCLERPLQTGHQCFDVSSKRIVISTARGIPVQTSLRESITKTSIGNIRLNQGHNTGPCYWRNQLINSGNWPIFSVTEVVDHITL